MMRFWFRFSMWVGVTASLLGLLLAASIQTFASAQAVATDTPTPGGPTPFITQTYSDPINVRTGPSTVYYPIIAQLPVGATAPALGVSPNRTWIEISFPGGPGGVGWVYAANVTLSPGFLPIVEPPPTATPVATSTIDPTFAAQFNIVPTETRLPTFTAPAPLVVPSFPDTTAPSVHSGFPIGIVIIGLALFGGLVLVVSVIGRR
ncbi:MAG TPA: SH3 domain-containing protein [Anaerolineales bacterium]|nr:SH3 domain-containing protein [Anaerolineales bacterium]